MRIAPAFPSAPTSTAPATPYATHVDPTDRAAEVAGAASLHDRALAARIERANAAVESGGHGVVPSRLVTTAGPGSPASYGRTQLLVSLQVDGLLRHAERPGGAARLARLGVSADDLRAIDARGEAATRWYAAIVGGEVTEASPIDRAAVADVRRRAAAGDMAGIAARYGAAFERDTGIPATELGFLALTTRVVDPRVSAEYRRLHAAHGQAGAIRRLVERHPELAALRDHVGDDRSFAFFLRRPRRNGEHGAAWYTRAARVDAPQYGRLISALVAGGDRITSADRSRRNLEVARRFLDGLPGATTLTDDRRALLVGQLARVQHGNPGFFRDRFGTPEAPRVASAHDLDRVLNQMMEAPAHSTDGDQGRSVRAFTERFLRPDPVSPGDRIVRP